MPNFTPGTRVTGYFYGQPQVGTVLAADTVQSPLAPRPHPDRVVWVRWETGLATMPHRVRWVMASTLSHA